VRGDLHEVKVTLQDGRNDCQTARANFAQHDWVFSSGFFVIPSEVEESLAQVLNQLEMSRLRST
jgi:hypothetical protein